MDYHPIWKKKEFIFFLTEDKEKKNQADKKERKKINLFYLQ